MKFTRERQMRDAVVAWMKAEGYAVMTEVSTRTCICDIAGGKLDPHAAQLRAAARRLSVVPVWKFDQVEGVSWLPSVQPLIAIELKLDRMAEVLRQARGHRMWADESYVAMPEPWASKVIHRAERDGIGVIAVGESARLLLRARRQPEMFTWCRAAISERFWRFRKELFPKEFARQTA